MKKNMKDTDVGKKALWNLEIFGKNKKAKQKHVADTDRRKKITHEWVEQINKNKVCSFYHEG